LVVGVGGAFLPGVEAPHPAVNTTSIAAVASTVPVTPG
jgi:hypothetical protein